VIPFKQLLLTMFYPLLHPTEPREHFTKHPSPSTCQKKQNQRFVVLPHEPILFLTRNDASLPFFLIFLSLALPRKQKEKATKAKKDPNAPKKALSPYMFFTQEHREVIKEENPGISFGEF